MAWKWFGVKTLTRVEAVGVPEYIDDNFDKDATLLEERIVLIKARSFDEAIKKGEKEAREYLSVYKNAYGQKVESRYLEYCDAFELFDEPNVSGTELFSSTEIISKDITDRIVIDNKVGRDDGVGPFLKRRKFWNAELRNV